MATQTFKVVGLTFRRGQYPDNLFAISEAIDASKTDDIRATTSWADVDALPRGPEVLLVRDAANPVDPNAIEVHVPMLGRRQFIGFVPKDLAARWAPRLDAGYTTTASVVAILITPNHIDRPGCEVEVEFHAPTGDPQ